MNTKLKLALWLSLVGIWLLPTKLTFAGSNPFLGEIRYFAGNFPPRGWAFCDGQLLSVNQNDALFSLIGTTYGGDGRTTFALPDMRGRVAVHEGEGAALTNRPLGAKFGAETVTLTTSQLPSHSHSLSASNDAANSTSPSGKSLGFAEIYSSAAPGQTLKASALTSTGNNQPISIMQPSTTTTCIIALVGTYPSRS